MKNLSLIFNKVYYSKINTVNFADLDSKEPEKKEKAVSVLKKNIECYNNRICSVVFNHERDFKGLNNENDPKCCTKDIAPQYFLMETMYPGLVIGLGNPHGAQLCDNDFNNGFSFDYVTGQPYIPGSSVKGVLRSCFKYYPEAVSEILEKNFSHSAQDTAALEEEIFDGKDTFFDAVIYAGNKYGKILGSDYITPHPDETKDPKPVFILKLLPEVRLMFEFHLYDGLLTAEEKRRLFIILLSVFGIGAKTNTGFGQLVHTENKDTTVIEDCGTIVCEDCGKTHILSDFEKEKIKTDGWRVTRCKDCREKRKLQKAGGGFNGKKR